MGYATTSTGHRTMNLGNEVRYLRTETVGGMLINVIQTIQNEAEEYLGLPEATAKALAEPYNQTTNPTGLVRTSLGGIKITVTSGLSSSWFSVFGCRGTIETAVASRMSDSNLWKVDYKKQTLSATADGGYVENI